MASNELVYASCCRMVRFELLKLAEWFRSQ